MSLDVLVIEDEPALAELVKINLTLRGISTLVANSGFEGLRIAQEQKPRVILLDIRLPDVDGWEVCCKIKSGALYEKTYRHISHCCCSEN